MEQSHRDSICGNMINLTNIKNSSFDLLLCELEKRRVFPSFMLKDLVNSRLTSVERKMKLFLDVQRRGPTAFEHLVDSLCAVGDDDLATLLKSYIPESQSEETHQELVVSEDNISEGADEVDANVDRSNEKFTLTGRRNNENFANEETGFWWKDQPNRRPEDEDQQMTPATVYNNGEGEKDCYRMRSKPRGLALVINVINFPLRDEKRKGAENDTENLRRLFIQLDFKSTFVIDPTFEELNEAIHSFIDKFSTENVDCCIVVVMSHGKENYHIKTSDGEWVDFYKIIRKRFNNETLKRFWKKPKVFLTQACRGKSDNYVLNDLSSQSQSPERENTLKRFKADGSHDESRKPLKGLQNTLILNSTTPGFKSMRDEERGTIFIESVCNVFRKHAHNTHLEEMMNIINSEVSKKGDFDDNGRPIGQSLHSEKMYPILKLFLNPGI